MDDAGAGDVGTRGGEGQGDALAKTGVGAGDQRDLAFQTERVVAHYVLPS